MIKITILMRRRLGIDRATFSAHWSTQHARLMREHAETLKIRRYVQCHALDQDVQADPDKDWDGIAEVWIDNLDILKESATSPTMIAARTLLADDERAFADSDRSVVIVTDEREIIGA